MFLKTYWIEIVTILLFLGTLKFVISRLIKLKNGDYQPIWNGWILPLSMPILVGIADIYTNLWLAIIEVALGLIGVSLLVYHEVHGVKHGISGFDI